MAEEKIISIITINYNGVKDTCELMDTLPLDDASIEVIVVDNASREDEATVIQQRYPQVKVIRSNVNLGFAGGNNLGTTSVSKLPVVSTYISSTTIPCCISKTNQ